MSAVKLSDDLVDEARRHGEAMSRSIAKQIEHWARIGRISEDNPDLSYEFIRGLLIAQQEAKDGKLTPYAFG